jgi:single-stranded-DNA-specific exonuclease
VSVVPNRKWNLPEPLPEACARLADELNIPLPIAGLLYRRGMGNPDSVGRFLDPSPARLHKPDSLPDIGKATDRICRALESGERVCVHGDYDVDGVTGTVLLVMVLRSLGGNVCYYLPHREVEGYGLSMSGIEFCQQEQVKLLVTTDCGSTDHEAVKAAREAGIDVVITDHHVVPAEFPEALALVNPKRPDSDYPFSELAGVGVAFKLAWSVLSKLDRPRGELTALLDLVGLGTIADVVPLRDENRILALLGLSAIRDTSRVGLRALMDRNRIRNRPVTTYDVGYIIAPRLNAAGRVDHALHSVELLLTDSKEEAGRIANKLEADNRSRQALEERVIKEATSIVERRGLTKSRVIVVARPNWPAGILGLAASRIADRYYRPTIAIGLEEGVSRGSGRSVSGFDLYAALQASAEHLTGFGGHRAAAGVTIDPDKVEDFSRAVNEHAEELPEEVFKPSLDVDSVVDLSELDEAFVNTLMRMEPFGSGNRTPVFASMGLEIVGYPRRFGKNHLRMRVRGGDNVMDAVAWRRSEDLPELVVGEPGHLDICYTVERRNWRGRTSTRLSVKDMRTSEHD